MTNWDKLEETEYGGNGRRKVWRRPMKNSEKLRHIYKTEPTEVFQEDEVPFTERLQ